MMNFLTSIPMPYRNLLVLAVIFLVAWLVSRIVIWWVERPFEWNPYT